MFRLGWTSRLRSVAITLVIGLAPTLALVASPAGASFSYNVLSPVTTGAGATGVAVSPTSGEIWVTNLGNFDGSTISAVNPTTLAVTNVSVGASSAPYDVAVSPDGTRVYVALVNTNRIAVVDAVNKTLLTSVNVGIAPSGVVVDSTGTVYATNAGSNTVSVIDPTTNTVSSTINVGADPEGIAVGPDDTVYVANWNVGSVAGGSVSVISGGAVAKTITVASPPPIGITVGADSQVYVARANDSLTTGNVSRIDPATSTVTAAASPTVGVYGIVVDSAGTIYAGGFNSNIVYVVDSDLSLVGQMQAGSFFMRDVALSLDESIVYAASYNLGVLTRLEPTYIPDTPIEITKQPSSSSTNECNRTVFSAAATGNPLPTVAWETSTDGGTSWEPLPATDTAGSFNDNGTLRASATVYADPSRNGHLFRAVFTNVLGNVPTDPATLTVPPMTISPADPAPDGTIPVGARPIDIVSDASGDMFVAEYVDGTVSTIEGGAVTDSLAIGERVERLAFAPDGETLYATRETMCHPNVFEIKNGVVTDEIDVPGMPGGVAVGPDGKVYVTSAYTETLEIIENGSVVASVDVPNLPEGVAVHPNGDVYVVSFGVGEDSMVTIVHPDLSTDSLTVGAGGNGIAIAADGTVYVTSASTNEVAVIRNGAVVTTLTVGSWPTGIAIDPDTGVVYVANLFSDNVSVIHQDQIVETFEIPGADADPGCGCGGGTDNTGPESVTVRPSDGYAYVTLTFADAVAKVQWIPPDPPEVPGPPVSVTATPAGSGTANVAFSPPLDDGGAEITSYTVTCTASGKPARAASGAGSPLTVTGLANGTTYSCRATATNSEGTGPPSDPATVKTGLPGPPGSVRGTVGRQQSGVLLQWSAAVTNGGTITKYTATCSSTNGGKTKSKSVKGTTRKVTIKALTPKRTYRCRVAATNAFGTGPAAVGATLFKL